MIKIARYVFPATLALTACQPPNDPDKATLDDLRLRVRVLEQGQEQIVAEMRRAEKKPAVERPLPAPTTESMAYELVGAGSTRRLYPSVARCEAARDAMQAVRDRANEGSGGSPRVIYPEALDCIPL